MRKFPITKNSNKIWQYHLTVLHINDHFGPDAAEEWFDLKVPEQLKPAVKELLKEANSNPKEPA